MTRNEFYSYVHSPAALTPEAIAELADALKEYPFCESAWMLMLTGMHSASNIRFENELRRGSAYIGNKAALYALINTPKEAESEAVSEATEPAAPTPSAPASSDYFAAELDTMPELQFASPGDYFGGTEQPYELTDTDEPQLTPDSRGSFCQWLDFMDNQPQGDGQPSAERARNADIIESFLTGQPAPQRSSDLPISPIDIKQQVEQSTSDNDDILTETLARIYTEQKQYAKAINIFKKLSLNNPEKSTYFASRIKELEKKLNE